MMKCNGTFGLQIKSSLSVVTEQHTPQQLARLPELSLVG